MSHVISDLKFLKYERRSVTGNVCNESTFRLSLVPSLRVTLRNVNQVNPNVDSLETFSATSFSIFQELLILSHHAAGLWKWLQSWDGSTIAKPFITFVQVYQLFARRCCFNQYLCTRCPPVYIYIYIAQIWLHITFHLIHGESRKYWVLSSKEKRNNLQNSLRIADFQLHVIGCPLKSVNPLWAR